MLAGLIRIGTGALAVCAYVLSRILVPVGDEHSFVHRGGKTSEMLPSCHFVSKAMGQKKYVVMATGVENTEEQNTRDTAAQARS